MSAQPTALHGLVASVHTCHHGMRPRTDDAEPGPSEDTGAGHARRCADDAGGCGSLVRRRAVRGCRASYNALAATSAGSHQPNGCGCRLRAAALPGRRASTQVSWLGRAGLTTCRATAGVSQSASSARLRALRAAATRDCSAARTVCAPRCPPRCRRHHIGRGGGG
eukprot:COSAG01_NODE_11090_length_2010_cov_1.351648_3_plen_165_part_01